MNYRTHKNTTDNLGIIRPDFLFSDWMFVWAALYYLATVYTTSTPAHNWVVNNMNPLIVFIVALIENGYLLGLIIIQTKNWGLAAKFIVMLLFTKIIPIYLLHDKPINILSNSIAFIAIFAAYNAYLYMNNTTIYKIYRNTNMYVLNNETKTPFFMMLHYLFGI